MKVHSSANIIEICKINATSTLIASIAQLLNAHGLIALKALIRLVIAKVQIHKTMHIFFSIC